MDLQMLKFRSAVISAIRDFFSSRGFLECDTPALAPALIPESCLEVFRTELLAPTGSKAKDVQLFLLPSPELYLKKIIAAHGVSVFQISKCYRNCESTGRLHSPEFTMLEYYKVDAGYMEMASLTEELLRALAQLAQKMIGAAPAAFHFARMSVDDAFAKWARISLSEGGEMGAGKNAAPKTEDEFLSYLKMRLARRAEAAGLGSFEKLAAMPLCDLFDILFIHCVEPELKEQPLTFLTDYPAFVNALAALNEPQGSLYRTRQRWELYADGIELANCYTEERDADAVAAFFKEECRKKTRARVRHPADADFPAQCAAMPPCSGVAMGVDRLLMFLAGKKSIEGVLPFANLELRQG